MPVSLCETGNTHQAIFGASKGECGHIVVEMRGAIIVNRVVVTEENRSHKDLALDCIRVLVGVLLGHDTAQRVASNENAVSGEASLSELFQCFVDVVVDQDGLRCIK